MIGIEKLQPALRRAKVVFATASIVLGLVLIASMATDWPALAHSAAAEAAGEHKFSDYALATSITSGQIAEKTRGKAVFRTLRIVAPKQADEAGRFHLTGTSSRNGDPSAYVRDTKLNQSLTLRIGSILGGQYEVVSIQKNVIELKRGSERIELRK